MLITLYSLSASIFSLRVSPSLIASRNIRNTSSSSSTVASTRSNSSLHLSSMLSVVLLSIIFLLSTSLMTFFAKSLSKKDGKLICDFIIVLMFSDKTLQATVASIASSVDPKKYK